MISIHRLQDFGHIDHGWLNAYHHFSFGDYHDLNRMGFSALRVVNDDTIQAHEGFPLHSHHDMEIITYVRKGAISHKDSLGNKGKTIAGDVQVMSAGTGIEHAEYNHEDEVTQLFQIWILPNQKSVQPRWETRQFPQQYAQDQLNLLVSGRDQDQAEKPLFIHQDAAIYASKIRAGDTIEHSLKHPAYVILATGRAHLNGETLQARDAAEVRDESKLKIEAQEDTELLLIELPDIS